MGKRGPAPTPTNIVDLRGNPGNRALNRNEPQPAVGATCPTWLDPEVKRKWRRIAPELERLELLTQIDRAALAAYCQAYARWYKAEKIVKAEGMTIETDKGNIIQHPAVWIANQMMKQMHKFMGEFVMTPAARTRISIERPPAQGDLFGDFVRGRDVG